jgi:hypothetical protein
MRLLLVLLICIPAIAVAEPEAPPPSTKSPGVALALSGGTTLAGAALLAAASQVDGDGSRGALIGVGSLAVALGPTLGHSYAGHTLNTGLVTRLVGAGVAAGGIALLLADGCLAGGHCGARINGDVGALMLIGGAATYGIGTVIEIAGAPGSARRHNASIALAPMGGRGLAVAGRF